MLRKFLSYYLIIVACLTSIQLSALAEDQHFPASIPTNPVIKGSGGVVVPKGTTLQRIYPPRLGDFRFNLTTSGFEGYSGSWASLGGPGSFPSQSANTVFAAPDLSAGLPTFRALLNNDLPVVSILKGGSGATTALGARTNFSVPSTTEAVLVTGANAFTGNQSMGSNKITSLADPTAAQDAASKFYVDSTIQGITDVKSSVRATTTANITLSGTQTIDGVALIAGDRVLVKDQITASENCIYVVSAGAWARSTDADVSSEVTAGLFTYVTEGTINADSGWILITNDPVVLDTTALSFTQFTGVGQITAGAGLTKTVNTLDVGGTANRITVAPDAVDIAATYAGQTSLTTLGTVTTGTWSADTVATTKGGTGLSSIISANQVLGANSAGTAYEGKTISSPSRNISVVNTAGSIALDVLAAEYRAVGSYTLTVDDKTTQVINGGGTVTLPLASTCPAGKMFIISRNAGSGTGLNVAIQGGDSFRSQRGDSTTTARACYYGGINGFVSDGVNRWDHILGVNPGKNIQYNADSGGGANNFNWDIFRVVTDTATTVGLQGYPGDGGPLGHTVRFCNTASNTITENLPGTTSGKMFLFVKTSASNSLVIAPSTGTRIDGLATDATLTMTGLQDWLWLSLDVTTWRVIGASPNVITTLLGAQSTANGGTGLTSPGTSGNLLTSNGTIWTSAAPASSVPVTITIFTGAGTAIAGFNRCDASGGAFSLALPTAASSTGKIFYVKNIGATGTVTVDADSAETIDGALTYALSAQYDSATLISDGTSWHVQ